MSNHPNLSTPNSSLQAAVQLAASRGVCAIGDLARMSGAAPFERDELVDGYLTIAPGTIYLGEERWWDYTDDPKQLFCRVCKVTVGNHYLPITTHVREKHQPVQCRDATAQRELEP